MSKTNPVRLDYGWMTLFPFDHRPFCAHYTVPSKKQPGKLLCYEIDPDTGHPCGVAMSAEISDLRNLSAKARFVYRINPLRRFVVLYRGGRAVVARLTELDPRETAQLRDLFANPNFW